MNEIDKMRKSELADMEKPEIQQLFYPCQKVIGQDENNDYL